LHALTGREKKSSPGERNLDTSSDEKKKGVLQSARIKRKTWMKKVQ